VSDIPVAIPLEHLLGFVLPAATPGAARDANATRVLDPKREGETLWLDNGDIRQGQLAGLDAQELRFDSGKGPESFPRAAVVAVGCDQSLIAYPPAKAPYLEVGLDDGSRIGVVAAKLDAGLLVGQARLGAPVRIKWDHIAYVQMRGGRARLLSAQPLAASQFVPYLDQHPERVGIDSTWDGHPIRIGSRRYEHGLGMLPRTLVAYTLQPGDQRFRATIALDDSAGELASVVFRVLVDRREAFVSPSVRPGDAPIDVDVDLAAGRSLVLVVEFAERGDVHDSAVWADARVIAAPESP
jgi:hypothetical protein